MGKRMKLMREAQGLSFRALAEASGLTKAYLIRLEHDKANPTLATVEAVATALKVRPEWLAYGCRASSGGERE